jgi:hypothetical protein
MGNQPPTVEQLIDRYAKKLADAVGLTLDAEDRTPGGFPAFLTTVATRAYSQNRDYLEETAAALADLDDVRPEVRDRRLREADSALREAAEDLSLC